MLYTRPCSLHFVLHEVLAGILVTFCPSSTWAACCTAPSHAVPCVAMHALLCCAEGVHPLHAMVHALQALRLQPAVHHQQLLVQLLRHLLAGCGLSACWGGAERQQRTSRLLLRPPLGCHRLNPLDLSLPHSPARVPVRLFPPLVFTSSRHCPRYNGGASLCVCTPAVGCSVGSKCVQVCRDHDHYWDLAVTPI